LSEVKEDQNEADGRDCKGVNWRSGIVLQVGHGGGVVRHGPR